MQYIYTRENLLPIVVELTYEDLKLIQKMAKYTIEMEETPEGIWRGDARKLDREVTEALEKAAIAVSCTFPSTEE